MFKFIRNLFTEKINEVSASRYMNNPEWFDVHWDELKNSFEKEKDFYAFIKLTLQNPSIRMLEVCKNHNYPFERMVFNICLNRYNIEVFRWIVDNKIISEKEVSDLYKMILDYFDNDSFQRFEYLFQSGYGFDPESSKVSFSTAEDAEKFWEYGKRHNIKFRFKVYFGTNLRQYLQWMRSHEIEDSNLTWMHVEHKYGLGGLKLLDEFGYFKPSRFAMGSYSREIEDFLISKGCEPLQVIHDEPSRLIYYDRN